MGQKISSFFYSSGGLNTTKEFEFTNNMYVELRVKLPNNAGGYAAFGEWQTNLLFLLKIKLN